MQVATLKGRSRHHLVICNRLVVSQAWKQRNIKYSGRKKFKKKVLAKGKTPYNEILSWTPFFKCLFYFIHDSMCSHIREREAVSTGFHNTVIPFLLPSTLAGSWPHVYALCRILATHMCIGHAFRLPQGSTPHVNIWLLALQLCSILTMPARLVL